MIKDPERFIPAFVSSGSDMLTVHIETVTPARLKAIRRGLSGKKVRLGISLNPGTPLSRIKGVLAMVDFVLVMSVYPGFGGQKFIPTVIPKIRKLRCLFRGDISVDGGVNDRVAGDLIKAGANILAAGSYIFGAKNTRLAIERIRNAK